MAARLELPPRSRYVHPYLIARIHSQPGNTDKALDLLREAARERSSYLALERADIAFVAIGPRRLRELTLA